MTFWRVIEGDCRDVLRGFDASSVHTCVCSPPYHALRDYGHADQIGLEVTVDEYVENLVAVFDEVRRVLRDDATLWCNLGDSYGPGKQLLGVPWRVAFALQARGWCLRSDVIWAKLAKPDARERHGPADEGARVRVHVVEGAAVLLGRRRYR